MKKSAIVLAATLFSFAAQAQQPCPMNYRFFETAIPHLDLPACPKELARPGAFCRVTTSHDNVHIFVFEEKGNQCLLAAKSYTDYQITVK